MHIPTEVMIKADLLDSECRYLACFFLRPAYLFLASASGNSTRNVLEDMLIDEI